MSKLFALGYIVGQAVRWRVDRDLLERFRFFCFVVLLISCFQTRLVAAGDEAVKDGDLPDIQDVVSMYRLNARVPKKLRVVFLEKDQLTEARPAALRRMQEAGQKILATETLTDTQRASMEREVIQLGERLEQLSHEPPKWRLVDYWTDFDNFQARAMRLNEMAGPESYGDEPATDFPDELLGGKRLLDFPGLQVVSRGIETDRVFRYWQGMATRPWLARVGPVPPWPMIMHPPLVLPQKAWGSRANPCDDFMLLAEQGDAQVVGFVEVQSRKLLLAYARSPQRSLRAFIDINHGGIPRRIELFDYYLKDEFSPGFKGLCVDHPRLTAQRIVEHIEIDELSVDGEQCFFPIAGRSVTLGRAASKDDAISATQDSLAIHSTSEWSVRKLQTDFDQTPSGFALPFPSGTTFFDDASGDAWIVGDREGELVRVAETAVVAVDQYEWMWWLLAGLILVLAVIAIILNRRKKLRGKS